MAEKKLRFCLLCGHSFEPKTDSQVTCEHCFTPKSMDDVVPQYDHTCVSCGRVYIDKDPFRLGFCPDCRYPNKSSNEKMFNICYLGRFAPTFDNSVEVEISYKYFSITIEKKTNRKTPIYHIISKHSESEIGIVKWYGAWRKFCFFPNGETIWDTNCLIEVISFIDNLNKKYKEDNKAYKHTVFKDNENEHYHIETKIIKKGEEKND